MAEDLLEHDTASLEYCLSRAPRSSNLPQDDDYEAAILRNKGVVSDVARELGVSRVTAHNAINKSDHLREILAHARRFNEA